MSAEHNFDADAFMRKYLERPSDATARLVFADWLEETGEEHNAAWAHFIRLKVEADRYPLNSPTRNEIERHAGQYAVHIRARLAIPAKLFVDYPKSLLQLLPAQNITVRLAEFALEQEKLHYLPESVARENLLFPLDVQDRVFLIAATNPTDLDLLQKLEFILNRDIVLVAAESEDIQDAINREYRQNETLAFDSGSFLVDFTDVAGGATLAVLHEEGPNPAFVEMMVHQALRMGADTISLAPGSTGIALRYRSGESWYAHQTLPSSFWPLFAERIAEMAGISLDGAFDDRVAACRGATGCISLQIANVHFTILTTIRLGTVEPGVTMNIRREPSID